MAHMQEGGDNAFSCLPGHFGNADGAPMRCCQPHWRAADRTGKVTWSDNYQWLWFNPHYESHGLKLHALTCGTLPRALCQRLR